MQVRLIDLSGDKPWPQFSIGIIFVGLILMIPVGGSIILGKVDRFFRLISFLGNILAYFETEATFWYRNRFCRISKIRINKN